MAVAAIVQPSFDFLELDEGPLNGSQPIDEYYPFEQILFLNCLGKGSESAIQCQSGNDGPMRSMQSATRAICSTSSSPDILGETKKDNAQGRISTRKHHRVPLSKAIFPEDEPITRALLIDVFPWMVGLLWVGLKVLGI
jgi:hypothetical protein